MWFSDIDALNALCGGLSRNEAWIAAAGLSFVGVALGLVALSLRRTASSRAARVFAVALLAAASGVATLTALEVLLFWLAPQSAGSTATLLGKRWYCAHWPPLNEQGFRDREWSSLDAERLLVVVGDSVAAGHGVRDREDRFSNVLAEQLGTEWDVINLSQPGWNTPQQIEALRALPVRPDVVLLSYFVNDIGPAAVDAGVHRRRPAPPERGHDVLSSTYLGSLIRLRIQGWRPTRVPKRSLELREAFDNDGVWAVHEREIVALVASARRGGAQPFAVVWPRISDLAGSVSVTRKVADLFRALGVATLDLGVVLGDRNPGPLMASRLDDHPNELLHAESSGLVYSLLCDRVAPRPRSCSSRSDLTR